MTGALQLHGLLAGPAPVPPDAPPHVQLAAGGLVALASPAPDATAAFGSAEGAMQGALHHDRLLGAYARQVDVVPVCFGSVFSAEATLSRAVEDGAAAWRDLLDRLRGLREFALTVDVDGQPSPRLAVDPAAGGRAFLAAKRAGVRQRQSVEEQRRILCARLRSRLVARAARVEERPPAPGRLAGLSLLAPAAAHETIAGLVAEVSMSAGHLGLAMRLTGPMPPYSFCDLPAEVEA